MKMNEQEKEIMRNRFASLDKQAERVKDEQDRLNESMKELSSRYSPNKPDAIIHVPREAGVHKGRKGKVEDCYLKYSIFQNEWRWFTFGVVLETSGEEGIHRFRFETKVELS